MLSLAIKNAILVILIILILHFLIKNYLVNQSYERHERQEDDEERDNHKDTHKSNHHLIREESSHKHVTGGIERFTEGRGNPDKDEIDLYNFIQSKKPLSDILDNKKTSTAEKQELNSDSFQPQPMSFGNYAPLL